MKNCTLVFAATLTAAIALGCEREDEIRSYSAPKESTPAGVPSPGQMPSQLPALANDTPSFTVPAGWKAIEGQQALRFAAFQASQEDPTAIVTVIPLGREGGELLPNINRWEGQLELPPTRAEDLGRITRQLEVNGVPVTVVDLTGPKLRTIAAIVPRGERVWFFKLTGTVATVAAQQANFEAFVHSIRFAAGQGAPQAEREATQPAGAARPGAQPRWDAPAGWVQQPERPMRFATFQTSSDAGAAEVIVSSFGAFGTMLDNINRWRGMVGLEPVNDESEQPVEKITIGGHDGALFDMAGPAGDGQPARRLVLAMVPVGEVVWFFRMAGTAETVEREKPAFEAFLKSVQFGP